MRFVYTRYLVILGVVLAMILGTLGGFNLLIDPYNIFKTPIVQGVNTQKNERGHITEPYRLMSSQYDTLIVGSSRVQAIYCEDIAALSPDLAAQCINVSTPHATFPWLAKLVRHANSIRPVKRIVFGLDFFGFNLSNFGFNPADEERLLNVPGKSNLTLINDVLRQVFSAGTTELSIQTLTGSMQSIRDFREVASPTVPPALAAGNNSNSFISIYPGIMGFYGNYSFSGPKGKPSSLECFRDLLSYCIRENIQVYFLISPVHSIMLELFQKHGIWDHYIRWEKELAAMVAEANSGLPSPLFSLWDFSGYNSITTEQIFSDNNEFLQSNYYADPFHYKRIVGRHMLETMFSGARSAPDFGFLLTPDNFEGHISDIYKSRDLYSWKNTAYFNMLRDSSRNSRPAMN